MTRSFRSIVPLIALATVTTTSPAQDLRPSQDGQANAAPAPATSAPSANVREAQHGPTLDRAAAGVRANRSEPAAPAPEPRRVETRQNDAMMIVGGAGLIVGAVIGGDAGTLLMVGGAVLGLFGLYKYLE